MGHAREPTEKVEDVPLSSGGGLKEKKAAAHVHPSEATSHARGISPFGSGADRNEGSPLGQGPGAWAWAWGPSRGSGVGCGLKSSGGEALRMRAHERLRVLDARSRAAGTAFGSLSWGMAALYAFFAVTDLVSGGAARTMAPIDVAVALGALALAWARAKGMSPHLGTALLFAMAIAASFARVAVADLPVLAVQLLLVQIAAGGLLYLPATAAFVHVVTAIGWIALSAPHAWESAWVPWHFVLASGLVVSVVLGRARMSALTRTELQRSSLEESEARYRALVEGLPDGICVLIDARIVFANAAALRIFGATRESDLIGREGPSLITPESASLILARNRAVEEDGVATEPIEVRAHRLDGGVVDLEMWGIPVAYEGRRADLSIVRDITERKRARERDRKLREVAAEQAVTRDLVRRMLSGSARGASMRILGRSLAQDVPGRDLDDYVKAFAAMGFGSVRLEAASDGRYLIHGHDLLERREENAQPTCDMALGFLEGAISRLENADVLGTETRCQSQGHASCVFVVRTRQVAPRSAPGMVGKRS